VVGTGTENGITYIDIRINGTPSASVLQGVQILFDTTTGIAASASQTWTESLYLRLVAGSTANIPNFRINIQQFNAAVFVLSNTIVIANPTSTQTRFAATSTFSASTTTHAVPLLALETTSGAAIDITLRIGLPQLELGAFATSVIPTTSASVTRAADVASVNNLSPWYNATEGTIYVEAQKTYSGSSAFPRLVQIGDATNSNSITTLWSDSLGRLYGAVNVAGAAQADIGNNGLTQTTIHKTAFSYKTNDFAISNDGASVVTDTSGTIPTVDRMFIGKDAGTTYLNGHIRRVAYYPVRLSNTELQNLTKQ
jgi:hypothetical protein